MDYFLMVDYGGTNIKVVLFDQSGTQIISSSFSTPRIEYNEYFREVALIEIWASLQVAIKEVMQQSAIDPADVKGISTVGHGKGLYLIDKTGQELGNGILSMDNRGQVTVKKLADELDEISSISKQPVLAVQAATLLRWMKDNQPEKYQQIGYVLAAKDYIRFKLTGAINTDFTDMSGNNLLNLETGDYDDRLLELFGISDIKAKLAPLLQSTDVSGYLTKETAELTGLVEGTPVITGMFDIDACAIATGVLTDEYISMIGGTWSINEYISDLPSPLAPNIMNSLFVDGEHYLVESSSATSAGNLDIMIQTILKDQVEIAKAEGQSIYDRLDNYLKSSDSQSTKVIFLPFLYGSNVHPYAKGAFIGLDSQTDDFAMIRAVYEGIVFSHKFHLEKLLATKQTATRAIRLSGGVVNSLEWVQMFADILQFPIEIVEAKELGSLGGAIATSVGLGMHRDLAEATEQMTRINQTLYPNQAEKEHYERKYQKYKKIITALEDVWE